MDQNAFRSLLSVPRQNGSPHTPTGRGSILPSKTKDDQKKPAEGTKAAFKPRKLKKQTESGYRDRATERRTGAAGDFAEAESILENFEKQHANDNDKEAVEEQRRYLGGDAEHTVLVKGLDFALLEQTRARLAASTSVQDDEELEEAFHGAMSGSVSPPVDSQPAITTSSSSKKRTREDLLRELKSKRAKSDTPVPPEDKALEEAKKEGKFKPIGFKPVGNSKPRDKDGKEVKKKKKKKLVESEANGGPSKSSGVDAVSSTEGGAKRKDEKAPEAASKTNEKLSVPEPVPQPENEDFDIFADAGEYEGINFGDDDNNSDLDSSKRETQAPETPNVTKPTQGAGEPSESRSKRKWIEDDEPPSPPSSRPLPSRTDSRGKAKESVASPKPHSPANGDLAPPESAPGQEEEAEAERITRLAPLASSAVPSIRDILEADQALEVERKRKERKEKKKKGHDDTGGGGGEKKVSKEAKLNRQYQKFKSYTEKKGSGS